MKNSSSARPRAVIWDMDGVIVDSGQLHLKAWQATFSKRGVNFTRADFSKTFGKKNRDTVIYKLKDKASDDVINEIGQEKEEMFRALVTKEGLAPLPGAVPLIESLDQQGFQQALASSAPRVNVELILHKLGLHHCFQAIVSEEDVTRGKPDPQPFLLVAERLGAMPDHSVVIEDAPAGIEAAHRGDIKVIGVTSSHKRTEMAKADLVVDSLEELDADKILELLKEK